MSTSAAVATEEKNDREWIFKVPPAAFKNLSPENRKYWFWAHLTFKRVLTPRKDLKPSDAVELRSEEVTESETEEESEEEESEEEEEENSKESKKNDGDSVAFGLRGLSLGSLDNRSLMPEMMSDI